MDASSIDPAKLAALFAKLYPFNWIPQKGPQEMAYGCKADIMGYGGAAGGGKSDLLIALALQAHTKSVIYRDAYVDLAGANSIIGRLKEIVAPLLGKNNGVTTHPNLQFVNPNDPEHVITFGALGKPDAEKTYQGRANDLIGFDEAAQLPESKIRYVLNWLRSTKPGQRKRVVFTSNPPQSQEGLWMLVWFGPWLNPQHALYGTVQYGELLYAARSSDDTLIWFREPGDVVFLDESGRTSRPATEEESRELDEGKADSIARRLQSYTFIRAGMDDNAYLDRAAYLMQLQQADPVTKARMLRGDFLIGHGSGDYQVIPSEWVDAAVERWRELRSTNKDSPQILVSCDVAQGGEDLTVTSAMRLDGTIDMPVVKNGKQTPDGASIVAEVMSVRRTDGVITIDCGGGWGNSAVEIMGPGRQNLPVRAFVANRASREMTRDRLHYFENMRAMGWWRLREALSPDAKDKIAIPPDDQLIAELKAPNFIMLPGNRIQIEAKKDIRSRLGRSTDRADCLMMMMPVRPEALNRVRLAVQPKQYVVPMKDPLGDDW